METRETTIQRLEELIKFTAYGIDIEDENASEIIFSYLKGYNLTEMSSFTTAIARGYPQENKMVLMQDGTYRLIILVRDIVASLDSEEGIAIIYDRTLDERFAFGKEIKRYDYISNDLGIMLKILYNQAELDLSRDERKRKEHGISS